MWSSRFPKTICWNDCPFPFKGLSLLLKIIWHFMWVSFWNLLLFSIGLCLPLCQYHTVLMTETLQLVLKLGNMRPPTLFLFFNIILFIWGGVYWISIWILGWIFTSLFFPFHAGCPMCWLIIVHSTLVILFISVKLLIILFYFWF